MAEKENENVQHGSNRTIRTRKLTGEGYATTILPEVAGDEGGGGISAGGVPSTTSGAIHEEGKHPFEKRKRKFF